MNESPLFKAIHDQGVTFVMPSEVKPQTLALNGVETHEVTGDVNTPPIVLALEDAMNYFRQEAIDLKPQIEEESRIKFLDLPWAYN